MRPGDLRYAVAVQRELHARAIALYEDLKHPDMPADFICYGFVNGGKHTCGHGWLDGIGEE